MGTMFQSRAKQIARKGRRRRHVIRSLPRGAGVPLACIGMVVATAFQRHFQSDVRLWDQHDDGLVQ